MKKREKILLAMLCHPSHCGPHLVGVFHFHFVSKSARFNYVNERTTAPPPPPNGIINCTKIVVILIEPTEPNTP